MTNFLRKLRQLESEILISKSNCHDKEVQRLLRSFIAGIASGIGANTETERFYMKNFRLSNQEMLKKWIRDKWKGKAESTLRVQMATLSKRLYNLYGEDFDIVFKSQDMERINRIRDTQIGIFLEGKISATDFLDWTIFEDDFEYSGKEYALEEVSDEGFEDVSYRFGRIYQTFQPRRNSVKTWRGTSS